MPGAEDLRIGGCCTDPEVRRCAPFLSWRSPGREFADGQGSARFHGRPHASQRSTAPDAVPSAAALTHPKWKEQLPTRKRASGKAAGYPANCQLPAPCSTWWSSADGSPSPPRICRAHTPSVGMFSAGGQVAPGRYVLPRDAWKGRSWRVPHSRVLDTFTGNHAVGVGCLDAVLSSSNSHKLDRELPSRPLLPRHTY